MGRDRLVQHMQTSKLKHTPPLFSVIIPTTGDRQEMLYRAIESVLEQKFKNYEIIIVAARNNLDLKHKIQKNKKIKIISSSYNLNASEARNLGSSKSNGMWVAFLDDDDYWDKKYLEFQAQIIKSHKSDLLIGTLYKVDLSSTVHKLSQKFSINDLYITNPGITGSNIIINRKSFDLVGGFPTSLTVSQDKALVINLLRMNFTYSIVTKAKAFNVEHNLVRLTNPSFQFKGYVEFYSYYRKFLDDSTEKLLLKKIVSYLKINYIKIYRKQTISNILNTMIILRYLLFFSIRIIKQKFK